MSYPLIQVSMPWYLIGETRVERESGKYRVPRWGTPLLSGTPRAERRVDRSQRWNCCRPAYSLKQLRPVDGRLYTAYAAVCT